LGDILVIVFFGLVPTGVTYYLQLHTCTAPVILLSAGCGFVIDTLLIVNNFRDRETDAIGGKKTLILLLNERAGYHLYFVCGLIGVMLAVTALVMLKTSIIITIIPCIYLLLLYLTYKRMGRIWKGRELNSILGETARNIFLFGILTSIALIL
jgi:1,4-dihydroxy-2-naphthoate octaprenyltransferase